MRKRPLKRCALCQTESLLCDSHLMPASALRLIRARQARNPNHINLSDTGHYTTSRPYKDYLLCEDCEVRFRTRGETWVSRHWYRGLHHFRIREILLRATPAGSLRDGGFFFRGASFPEIDMDQLIYFALSVIWRAAAHKWSDGHRTINLDLGPYLEPLRLFFLDKAAFPSCMILVVRVCSLTDYAPSVNFPESTRSVLSRFHAFSVLGMAFLLHVGKTLDVDSALAAAPSPDGFIAVVPQLDLDDQRRAVERYRKAVARGFHPSH